MLASVYNAFAQRACDLLLVPEGNNLCILEENTDDFSVIRACRGNTVFYRAFSPSAIGYEWSVIGGNYQLNGDSTICQVTWGEDYSGMVTVDALLSDSSVCTSRIQVLLEDKPVADIISIPNYIVNVNDPEEKWLEVCAGDTLSFIDNSTSEERPIVDYYWEFPYGISNNRSISFVAREPGDYSIIHRVYNECGCYDEVTINLIVKDECPLELSCYGTVCAYSQQSYSMLSPNCTDYLWSVQGGTLSSPQHNPGILVQWGAPESGYGMIYLDGANCECECKSRKSIRIPVISGNINITGPDTLCIYNQYTYSVPLWGATQYSWTVTPSTGVTFAEKNNILTLTPQQNGTYNISVTYSCEFLGCGPYTVTKTIYVQNPLAVTTTPSEEEVCLATELSFATNTTGASQWTVRLNDSIIYTGSAPSLAYTFNTSGTYVVQARNANYCNEATKIVNVSDNPPAPSMIYGPDTICPSFSAEYSATPSSRYNYILWEWTANGDTHTYPGNKVNITFGNTVDDINVYQVSRRTGCRSEASVYHVSPFQLADWPYHDTIRVCQGQSITLSRLRDQSNYGVLYEWEAVPAAPLSIQDDHLSAEVSLLANHTDNLPTTVRLILKRVYCGTYQYDTAIVRVGEIDAPRIIHNPVCAGQSASFSAISSSEANMGATYWYIDSETESREYGLPANLGFGNTNTHTVHLHYVSTTGCAVDTYDTVTPCPPLPDMHIDTSGNMLSVVISGDTTGYGYKWMTGETTPSIVASPDNYWCTITDPHCGCKKTISYKKHEHRPDCVQVDSAFRIVNHCYNIISIAQINGPGLHYPYHALLSQNSHQLDCSITHPGQRIMVPDTGHYTITVSWSAGDTCYQCTVSDSIEHAITMQITQNCRRELEIDGHLEDGSPLFIIAQIYDLSDHLVSMKSSIGHVDVSKPDTGWHRAHVIFGDVNCYIDKSIHFDATPTIQSIDVRSTMCEKTAFTFSADATGEDLTYMWNFGDNSWNYGNGIGHVYGGPFYPQVTITVTDRNGCSVSDMVNVAVKDNYLKRYSLDTMYIPTCPGDSAVIRTRLDLNNLYSWYPCRQFTGNIANVYEAGNYMVDITTILEQCRKQLVTNVPYPNEPYASILCDSTYCLYDVAELVGGVGPEYTYQWYVHSPNTTYSATTATFNCHLADTGLHQVILLVSDTNGCTSSDTAWFRVHPLPPAPSLQFCGNPCITDGPVEICSTDGRELLWSNGTKGSSALYFTDGSAVAYYIDATTGCKSYGSTLLIPEAPDFDGLLTGCYCIEEHHLPTDLSLYTLGNTSNLPWEWYLGDSPIISGTILPDPSPLPILSEGEYRLLVPDYGMGCRTTSPTLTIETRDCENPINPEEIQSVWLEILKKDCEQRECELYYELSVKLCNDGEEPVCIDNIYPILPVSYSLTANMPIMLNPGDCQEFSINVAYDFSSSGVYLFAMECGEEYVEYFKVDLSDWTDCVRFDTCVLNMTYSFALKQSLSQPNQSAFFDFVLTLPSPSGTMIAVWCDQGQIIDGHNAGASYSGLLMMDYGLMTQSVVANDVFSFHIICCDENKICVSDICIPYKELWEACSPLGQKGLPTPGDGTEGNLSDDNETFLLVPNPTTRVVSVLRKTNETTNNEIQLIEVFSVNGQKVLSQESSNQFDVSRLSKGTYIVKVVTANNGHEYLKLIKQ